jgi:hypothetical protein
MPAELIVTGCYRSGTTLLEKLLHAHPQALVASQPFPALYAHVKELFDAARGLERRYPLSHRFLESEYTDTDFAGFLAERRLIDADLAAIFDQLTRYEAGHWTPEIRGARAAIRPDTFLGVYRQFMRVVCKSIPKPGAGVIGSKEILVEEYLPYLLAHGHHAIVIIRDPRDMIASLNFGERDNSTGRARPVLYSLRVWRKSVATALALEGHPRFRWLRYEDLCTRPEREMAALAEFLQLPPFSSDALDLPLTDQHGRNWRGNSSFTDRAGISEDSVGRFRAVLPGAVQSMIETAAAPEMVLLGYATSPVSEASLTGYADPFEHVHEKFPADYSSDAKRVRAELRRLELLASPSELSDEDATRWFIYPAAYRRLRSARSVTAPANSGPR